MSRQPFTVCEDKNIYLDHNATTPPALFLRAKLDEWFGLWGNPSSIHWTGRGPKSLLRETRKKIAQFIGAHPLEIIFTSGGSEANNLAIKGIYSALNKKNRTHYMVSAIEHPSVFKVMEFIKSRGAEVDIIPVDRGGNIDLDFYRHHLRANTALVSVMMANNETGNIFPIKEMAQMAHEVGALFHSDMVQTLGKISFDIKNLGIDLASFSGHKFYALKGAGFLWVRSNTPLVSLIHGGGQERGRRAGTENLLAIAAMGEMTQFKSEVTYQESRVGQLRDLLEKKILTEIEGVKVTGGEAPRLPNTISLVLSEVDGESLLMNLDLEGFSVSTGAACSSGNPEPSPVLLAMGLSRAEAQSSLRISLGWTTQEEDVLKFFAALKKTVIHLRGITKNWQMGEK